jgi:hypothetical protein
VKEQVLDADFRSPAERSAMNEWSGREKRMNAGKSSALFRPLPSYSHSGSIRCE